MKKIFTAAGVIFGLILLLSLGLSVTVASPATYCVRKIGSDVDTGACPNNAWLTVDHAANTVVAGDIVYIGSGVYTEGVTIDTSGISGSEIEWRADIDGSQTGDPGLVIITAYDDWQSPTARNFSLDLNEKTFNEFYHIIFLGGEIAAVEDANATAHQAYEGVIFDGCVMAQGDELVEYAIELNVNQGVEPTYDGLQIRNCTVLGKAVIYHDNQEVAHVNLKWDITNTLFAVGNARSVEFSSGVTGTYSIGGIAIHNNSSMGGTEFVYTEHIKNTTNPITATNNVAFYVDYMLSGGTGTVAGAFLIEDNSCTPCDSYKAGTLTDVSGNDNTVTTPLFGGFADIALRQVMGWSPYRPWEPIFLPDESFADGGTIDRGDATFAPAADIYGNSRPMFDNADDRGAVETRFRGEPETTTVYTDTYSLRLDGQGFHDMHIPVVAQAMTVTVYARYDGTYAGTLPQLKVYNIPGIADHVDTMVVAADTWEQLQCTFTPTSAGYAIMRLVSNDTSANGECYFDNAAFQ